MQNNLPSPYYRVTVKAIIRDKDGKLLVGQADNGTWEIPGGGWEHDETFDECIKREIKEELGTEVAHVGKILFTYIGKEQGKTPMLRLATELELADYNFRGKGILQAKFVDKDELLSLHLVPNEAGIKKCVDLIWL